MVDQLIGLLLLGLGINKSMYAPNPNVKGDSTVVSQTAKPTFRLKRENFEDRKEGSRAANTKHVFNVRAFGAGVLKMQTNFAEVLEASREAAKQEFEDHKEEFKQRLALIRDTKKQAVVERLNTNCQEVNTKRTEKMKGMLEKLSLVLTNVTTRAASASATGRDTSAVETAITSAQTAIADAQTMVAAQAGMTCTITILSEANLKTDVGEAISQLQQELKTVYERVLVARKAVGDAIKLL